MVCYNCKSKMDVIDIQCPRDIKNDAHLHYKCGQCNYLPSCVWGINEDI